MIQRAAMRAKSAPNVLALSVVGNRMDDQWNCFGMFWQGGVRSHSEPPML